MHLSQRLQSCVVAASVVMAMTTAKAGVLITIDKSAQSMGVSVDGVQRWNWPVSTGRRGYDTPSGSYRPFRMEPAHFSREWDSAPMPHSIFFTRIGHAIHGTYESAYLGSAVSHGCVRLSTANATQLYELVKAEGLSNTRVVITGWTGQPSNSQWFSSQNPNPFFGQTAYGQSSYRQSDYGQSAYGQNWFGQNSVNQRPTGRRNHTVPNGWFQSQ
jgi:L,D-transpeptidase catalytic domain